MNGGEISLSQPPELERLKFRIKIVKRFLVDNRQFETEKPFSHVQNADAIFSRTSLVSSPKH